MIAVLPAQADKWDDQIRQTHRLFGRSAAPAYEWDSVLSSTIHTFLVENAPGDGTLTDAQVAAVVRFTSGEYRNFFDLTTSLSQVLNVVILLEEVAKGRRQLPVAPWVELESLRQTLVREFMQGLLNLRNSPQADQLVEYLRMEQVIGRCRIGECSLRGTIEQGIHDLINRSGVAKEAMELTRCQWMVTQHVGSLADTTLVVK